ncbi:drug resistance transporter, EmrB/QacA subfamily [Klenkia soli]|uniref:Drug resistance transporter, EmrB/QacA subfamily n=1 Tax=Klenkia soli TaxID=1052260 RepID=A0A1H0L0K9_9ACTN|nr:DHA2 family efflux MFS transporter permease subunit [Klenkia soli]SDO61566.1 drug resistance transporter, EmrB/QacA subfamily [Klenkia soli]
MPNPSQRTSLVLAVLSVAAFVASLDVFIVNVAFDDIGADFTGSTLSQLSWVLNAYAIVYAALLVPAGRIADRYGRKGGFLLGLGVFTAASAACAAADGVWWLVAFRAVQAVGAALLTPASLGLVIASVPPERRAGAVRIWASTGAVAAALGPAVGGVLVEASWRWVFLVNLPIGAVALVGAALLVPRSRDEAASSLPDVRGAVLLALAIGALTLGLVEGPDWGWGSARTSAAWVVSVVALGGFLLSSRRHASPVVDPALLRVRAFVWANATSLLFAVPFAAALLTNILWMQQVWGYSAIRTGLAIAPGPLMVPVFAAVSHRLARRFPVGWLVAFGCVLLGAGGVLTAASVGPTPDYVGDLLPGWLIGGVGVGFALPSILSSATADLPPARAATGSAVVNMSRQIGTALGVSLVVAVLGTPVGFDAARTAFRYTWWALAAVAVLAALAAPGMTPRRPGGGSGAGTETVPTSAGLAGSQT